MPPGPASSVKAIYVKSYTRPYTHHVYRYNSYSIYC